MALVINTRLLIADNESLKIDIKHRIAASVSLPERE